MGKMTRQDANTEIINAISLCAARHADWRFFQILQNLGIDPNDGADRFYEESVETLGRLNRC